MTEAFIRPKLFALRTETPLNIRELPWFKPLNYSILNNPVDGDLAQRRFNEAFTLVMRDQGHNIIEDPKGFSSRKEGKINVMLSYEDVEDGPGLIVNRIKEHFAPFALPPVFPLALEIKSKYKLPERPENLFTVITIPETLSDKSHLFVVELGRAAAAKIGTPRIIFLSGDKKTGDIDEITNFTLEGGHDTTKVRNGNIKEAVEQSRDRVVAIGSTTEVGHNYKVRENIIPLEVYRTFKGPRLLREAGERMDGLKLLPDVLPVSKYVSPGLATFYKRFLNMGQFSEGMLVVRDPVSGIIETTASGSWEVDKRHLKEDEVSNITGMDKDGNLQVDGVVDFKAKGPSVEALETYLALRKYSIIRAGIHTHVGIDDVDENIVEWIPYNPNFPQGFCCGTDKNADVTMSQLALSNAIKDPNDPRAIVAYMLKYHGAMAFELDKRVTRNLDPFTHLLDVFDPKEIGAIRYNPYHIHQKD